MDIYLASRSADDVGKLIARLTLGILILLHGAGKIVHGIDPIQGMVQGAGLPGFVAYGVFFGEVLGPILLLVGYYARVGAGLIAINMVVAVALAHRHDIFTLSQHGGWTLELQGMFLFTALALVLMGPGRLGINRR
jgi:putative oxidoreductase